MFEHALDRRETGTTGNEEHRAIRLLAQRECPERRLDAQHSLVLEGIEDKIGEGSTLDVTDMQFDELVVMRCIGNGERAALAIFQEKFKILSREELQALRIRQLQHHAHDIVSQGLVDVYLARHDPWLDLGRTLEQMGFDQQIAGRNSLADQHTILIVRQSRRVAMGIVKTAGDKLHLACPAIPAATAVGEDHILPQRSIENCLVLADLKRPALWLNCDLKFVHKLELTI